MLVDNTTGTRVIQCVACAGNTDGRCLVCGRGFRCQLCADGYYLDASKLCKPVSGSAPWLGWADCMGWPLQQRGCAPHQAALRQLACLRVQAACLHAAGCVAQAQQRCEHAGTWNAAVRQLACLTMITQWVPRHMPPHAGMCLLPTLRACCCSPRRPVVLQCPSDCGPATSVDELPGTCTGPAKCTRCRAPYTGVSGGACSRCTDSSCMDCATDASQCRKCWPGSTVHPVTKRCVDCAGYGCATCSGPTTKLCLSCFTGHGLIAPPGQAEGRCGRCQAAGCAACDGNLYQCTRCVDGQEAFGIYGLAFQWDPATRRCIALDSIAPTEYS